MAAAPYIKALEYFSVENSHTLGHALYVAKVTDMANFPENLVDVLAWQCAANVLQVVGNEKAMTYCQGRVQKFIQENTF